ncbi:MAG TPA: acyl-CoA dehydrogenase family protein [Pilimelia sp.]|nr:acyl-CoA dehydrogenase family protein [Pilimelia sp.]
MEDLKVLDIAARIADDVLFPAALSVEAADTVPASHLDRLAEAGFYGLAGPPELTPLDVPDFAAACRVVEVLAGGCLSTTFVWAQHHSAVMAVAFGPNEQIRERWLEPLCTGRRRAGLSLGSAVRKGPPPLRATAVDGGYRFDGEASWVTGWGLVDTLYAAGRDENEMLVWALLDATECDTMTVRPLRMVALNSTRTVHVTFDNHFVPADRVAAVLPHAAWLERDAGNLRFNGSFSLGVAARCLRLRGPSRLDAELERCRTALAEAPPEELPAARAAASEFVLRAAAALVASVGSRAVLLEEHAQRLLREATFLLVFGARPAIREALLERLDSAQPAGGAAGVLST